MRRRAYSPWSVDTSGRMRFTALAYRTRCVNLQQQGEEEEEEKGRSMARWSRVCSVRDGRAKRERRGPEKRGRGIGGVFEARSSSSSSSSIGRGMMMIMVCVCVINKP